MNESVLQIVPNSVDLVKFEDQHENFRDISRFVIQRVLVPIIASIGVVGNSVTIVIMTRKRMMSSTNCYLAALATFDMLYLVFTFVLSLAHYPNITHNEYRLYWILWPLFVLICDASSNASVWLTVTFTIERYILVNSPLRGKVFCTPSRARRIIIILSVICFLITVPTAFEWKTSQTMNTITNETNIHMISSDLGLNSVYKRVYYYLTAIVFVFLPLIILSVFNIFLIRSVRISSIKRRTMTMYPGQGAKWANDAANRCLQSKNNRLDRHRQESRITVMLIAVVILFLVCQTPTACMLLYTAIDDQSDDDPSRQSLIRGLGNIFNFLVAINSGGNFLLYCLLSKNYRQTFVKTFFPNLSKQSKLSSNIINSHKCNTSFTK